MFWILILAFLQLSRAIIVDLPDGKIQGIIESTLIGTQYNSFLAIRYAAPPVGELRFQPPVAVTPWDDVYDATSEKHVCYQVYEDSEKESEDCLFINVFSPKDLTVSRVENDLPVMVFIHGGAFEQGAGYMIEGGVGPKFFMNENIVVAAFNYRLGPFGFLSTGDDVIPGNIGLKDQLFALEWIQKNIQYFGGDPTKVTIFGQSAGASSVSYQILSPKSQGLFRGAIQESGSALSPWAYQRNSTKISYLTAQYVDTNYSGTTSQELLDFLRSVPASAIDQASAALNNDYADYNNLQVSKGFLYTPVIEVPHDGAFLTEPMYELFKSGQYNQIPTIIGMNAEEMMSLIEGDSSGLWYAYDTQPEILVPFNLHIDDVDLKVELGSEIRDFFGGPGGFENNLANCIRFHSFFDFDKAQIKQAQLMSAHSTVYFYNFAYSGLMGNNKDRLEGTGNVTHGEELNYIFSRWYSDEIPDNTNPAYFPDADTVVHNNILSMWTNFVKYLNPTPDYDQLTKWDPVDASQFKHLEIWPQSIMINDYPKSDMYLFWDQLYKNYAVPPLDTF
ncbi:hypothetical protein GWI33_014106 [Rhynchophorus ferrugineus]|uniref:Carboxylic ester hydrolase n=1 Tax=Rhynchophorus ferrugineus TaxID=354439 RepID=A0A834I5S7_RHYFE|nr:hypothetical protein GWI33_014106 [Rhynchophorus ferrugineus]